MKGGKAGRMEQGNQKLELPVGYIRNAGKGRETGKCSKLMEGWKERCRRDGGCEKRTSRPTNLRF